MTTRASRGDSFGERFRAGSLLVSHFVAYCGGVCLLVTVNMFLGGAAWFQWPSLVWGLLLVAHILTVVIGGARRRPLDA
jgi:uncharacterized membrane protein